MLGWMVQWLKEVRRKNGWLDAWLDGSMVEWFDGSIV
jgi:hypothetical protein